MELISIAFLLQLASGVLQGCVRRANSNAIANFRHLRHLKIKQALEEAIYTHLIHVLTVSKETAAIAAKIDSFLTTCRENVITKVPDYTYSEAMLSRAKSSGDFAQCCREDLLQFVLLCITTELRAFLEDTILRQQLELLRQSTASWDPEVSTAFQHLELDEGEVDFEDTPVTKEEFLRSLSSEMKNSLCNAYRVALDEAAQQIWIVQVFDAIRSFFRDLWRRVTSLFRTKHPESPPPAASPSPPLPPPSDGKESSILTKVPSELMTAQWKTRETDRILDQITRLEIGSQICGMLRDYIGVVHKEQQNQFAREEALNMAYKQIAREDRKKISDLTPPFASAYIVAAGVRSRYEIRDVSILGPLGVGSQGTVHKCRVHQVKADSSKELIVAMKQVGIFSEF